MGVIQVPTLVDRVSEVTFGLARKHSNSFVVDMAECISLLLNLVLGL